MRQGNTAVNNDDVVTIVKMEREAWRILQRVAEEHGLVLGHCQ